MATYTDNYTMTKPTYAEQADISVINANMDIIDNVMHSSQISLAPAYDINETYNTGDIVMHELLMYKCLADNVTGAWDSTKWTRTTAGEESGGGADLDIYGEASGTAEASFSDGAEASLVKCIVEIEATQSGSGTPSPSNIRPISGHTDVTVTVASTSGGSGEDTTVSLGRTVYKGSLDVTTGLLTVTHAITDVNTVIANRTTSYSNPVFYGEISGMKVGSQTIIAEAFDGIESKLSAQNFANNSSNGDCANNSNNTQFFIRADEYTDVPSLKTALGTTKIQYELATPQTFNLTPTQVKTLLGQNYVSHDGGGTISLVYVKGDAPIKPNPADAEIPLTGLEIGGEKFSIRNGAVKAELYSNVTVSNPSVIVLNDDIFNYDMISVRFFRDADSIPENSVYITIDTQLLEIDQTISFIGWAGNNEFVLYKLTSRNTLTLVLNGSRFYIRKITGIRY